jgi:hypothetical protein
MPDLLCLRRPLSWSSRARASHWRGQARLVSPHRPNQYTYGRAAGTPPAISGVVGNRSAYRGSQVPKDGKLEITCNLRSVAQNLQMPYDPALGYNMRFMKDLDRCANAVA